jgi:hypothetical protein
VSSAVVNIVLANHIVYFLTLRGCASEPESRDQTSHQVRRYCGAKLEGFLRWISEAEGGIRADVSPGTILLLTL